MSDAVQPTSGIENTTAIESGGDDASNADNPVSSEKMQDLKSAYQEKGIQGLLEELVKLIEETGAKSETPPAGGEQPSTEKPAGGEKAPSIEEIIKQIVKELKLSEGENQELADRTAGKQDTGDDQTSTDMPAVHQSQM